MDTIRNRKNVKLADFTKLVETCSYHYGTAPYHFQKQIYKRPKLIVTTSDQLLQASQQFSFFFFKDESSKCRESLKIKSCAELSYTTMLTINAACKWKQLLTKQISIQKDIRNNMYRFTAKLGIINKILNHKAL